MEEKLLKHKERRKERWKKVCNTVEEKHIQTIDNQAERGELFLLRKTRRVLFSRTNVSSNKYRDNFPPSFLHFIFFQKFASRRSRGKNDKERERGKGRQEEVVSFVLKRCDCHNSFSLLCLFISTVIHTFPFPPSLSFIPHSLFSDSFQERKRERREG